MSEQFAGEGWSAWPAPAKLNLFLHLTGRRADGYHLLETVFQLLDWGDTVHLRVRDDGVIRRVEALADVPEDQDLTVRAARLLQNACGCRLGADLAVSKRIPMGGGLGGGSSDAASVLVALNHLWSCALDIDQLAKLGLTLGADVPVFVRGQSAFADGIGERLQPLELPAQTFIVVDPGVSLPTRELFQAIELTRDSSPLTMSGFVSGAKAQNAFEPIVRARYLAVAQALDWLAEFGESRLSGSGGAVFLPVDADFAEAIVAKCPTGMRAWIARGVNRSPLHDVLARKIQHKV